jgi:NADPH-dependent curcumin reductase CurA
MADLNRQIVLKSRPEGMPGLDNFVLTKSAIPEPGDGEVLMRTLYLSLDPYMRGRMSAAKSYAKPAEVGQPSRPSRVHRHCHAFLLPLRLAPGDALAGRLQHHWTRSL